jgi:hypothetical protein
MIKHTTELDHHIATRATAIPAPARSEYLDSTSP